MDIIDHVLSSDIIGIIMLPTVSFGDSQASAVMIRLFGGALGCWRIVRYTV
jgi:hypothetical protein